MSSVEQNKGNPGGRNVYGASYHLYESSSSSSLSTMNRFTHDLRLLPRHVKGEDTVWGWRDNLIDVWCPGYTYERVPVGWFPPDEEVGIIGRAYHRFTNEDDDMNGVTDYHDYNDRVKNMNEGAGKRITVSTLEGRSSGSRRARSEVGDIGNNGRNGLRKRQSERETGGGDKSSAGRDCIVQ